MDALFGEERSDPLLGAQAPDSPLRRTQAGLGREPIGAEPLPDYRLIDIHMDGGSDEVGAVAGALRDRIGASFT